MDIRLSAIHLYPVKGIRGVAVERAPVLAEGLRHDRRWMIVDGQGRFISQRTEPALALVAGDFDGPCLRLTGPGREPLDLEIPTGRHRIQVTVWRDQVDAAAAAAPADRWISAYLGRPCRFAFLDREFARPISSRRGRPGETVSFADGFPCLLVSEASLADLNRRLQVPVPMDRFRPNLVVDGCEAFAEDRWSEVAIGGAVFRCAGPCARCGVTTVDQKTGTVESHEPLDTLASYRQGPQGIVFGVNLVPVQTGLLTVGNKVLSLHK